MTRRKGLVVVMVNSGEVCPECGTTMGPEHDRYTKCPSFARAQVRDDDETRLADEQREDDLVDEVVERMDEADDVVAQIIANAGGAGGGKPPVSGVAAGAADDEPRRDRGDVINAYYPRADLSGWNLEYANLSRMDLSKAKLEGANLAGADLHFSNLSQALMGNADLESADLTEAILVEVSLWEANLEGASLTDTNLIDADLSDANLKDANLRGADLSHACMGGADLSRADLTRTCLENVDLTGANLSGANLRGAELHATDLRGADLRGVEVGPEAEFMASELHEQWRETRKNADGTFEPRWKDDGNGGQVDIANTRYADLPDKWQQENREAARVALVAVRANTYEGIFPDQGQIDDAATIIHEQWLLRNGSWAEDHQKLPFDQLSPAEQDKDRDQVWQAIAAQERYTAKQTS